MAFQNLSGSCVDDFEPRIKCGKISRSRSELASMLWLWIVGARILQFYPGVIVNRAGSYSGQKPAKISAGAQRHQRTISVCPIQTGSPIV